MAGAGCAKAAALARQKAAANIGKPLPEAAPRSPVIRELEKLTDALAGPAAAPKRRLFGLMRA